MIHYRIRHRTVYEYTHPVTVSHHSARVSPQTTGSQKCSEFELAIDPEPAVRSMRTDYFGNQVCFFSIQEIHRRLDITADSQVSVDRPTSLAPGLSLAWSDVAGLFRDPVSPDVVAAYQFCFDSPLLRSLPELADYARESFAKEVPLLAGVADLSRRIHADFKYDPVATTVATPLAEVLEKRRGVCQDFAHLAIASLRSLGLSARYVSGYLRTHAAPGRTRLIGADASHAWFSVYCPVAGWVDFDPTNNALPAEEHITVACGRDYSDVSPVSGILVGGGSHKVKVSVDVAEINSVAPGDTFSA